jgi:oligopeptide/dipeptide ABC transporter ATP-binding protein
LGNELIRALDIRDRISGGMEMLEVRDLEVAFWPVAPLSGVSFSLAKGETLGIVGESGSGKSLTAMSVMGLLPLSGGRVTAGSILFDGVELTMLPETAFCKLRCGRLGLITQNPMTSLDRLQRIGPKVDAVERLHLSMTAQEARARTVVTLGTLCIPEPATICDRYPHQMSGGQKQRVGIARALALRPSLLVLDEPTAWLDVSVQAQIISMLQTLRDDLGLTYLFISHDLSLVRYFCDDILAVYLGGVVEALPDTDVRARHPYTQTLMDSTFAPDPKKRRIIAPFEGEVLSPFDLPRVRAFADRCLHATDICRVENPILSRGTAHPVACHHP